MTPASFCALHEPQDSPTLGSFEIAELDGTYVEQGQWRTNGGTNVGTGENYQPSPLELDGICRQEKGRNIRPQPIYVPYRPGA